MVGRRGLLSLLFLTSLLGGAAETDNLRELVRRGCDLRKQNDLRLREYSIFRRVHRRQFDSNGKSKSDEIYTVKTDTVNGVRASWLIERNDKPLSNDEKQREEKKLRRRLAEHHKSADKDDWDVDDRFFQELPDALDFKLVGTEQIAGRDVMIIDFWPRPGYSPKSMRARVFEKCRGRVWLDSKDYQVHKVEAELFDSVSFGWGMARVEKGSRYVLEQDRLDDGAWVPKVETVKFAGRVMMVRVANGEVDTRYRVVPSEARQAALPARVARPVSPDVD